MIKHIIQIQSILTLRMLQEKNEDEQIAKLIELLIKKTEKQFHGFCDSLVKSEQSQLVPYLLLQPGK